MASSGCSPDGRPHLLFSSSSGRRRVGYRVGHRMLRRAALTALAARTSEPPASEGHLLNLLNGHLPNGHLLTLRQSDAGSYAAGLHATGLHADLHDRTTRRSPHSECSAAGKAAGGGPVGLEAPLAEQAWEGAAARAEAAEARARREAQLAKAEAQVAMDT